MQNDQYGKTIEVDAVDPEGIAMKLTVTIHQTVDRNGVYLATRTVRTTDGVYLSPDQIDGWHISGSGRKYRALEDLPYARPIE